MPLHWEIAGMIPRGSESSRPVEITGKRQSLGKTGHPGLTHWASFWRTLQKTADTKGVPLVLRSERMQRTGFWLALCLKSARGAAYISPARQGWEPWKRKYPAP